MKAHVYNDRLVEVEIAGRKCYFNFSLRAAKEMARNNKNIEKLGDELDGLGEDEAIEMMSGIYALLLQEGSRYMSIVEKEDVPCFTSEELETVLTIDEMTGLQDKFTEAINKGGARETEVKPDPKNAVAAQKGK